MYDGHDNIKDNLIKAESHSTGVNCILNLKNKISNIIILQTRTLHFLLSVHETQETFI